MRRILLLALPLLACDPSEPAAAPAKAAQRLDIAPPTLDSELKDKPTKLAPIKLEPQPRLDVDMSAFELGCSAHSDCTLVHPYPCATCGCTNVPLRVADHERYLEARAAITCPPRAPVTGGAGCGGCPGYRARCIAGSCVAEVH